MGLYGDRVCETTTTTGTGTVTLAGAVANYQAFSAEFATGQRVRYVIVGGTDWEVGEGVYTSSGTTLTRERVFNSSNAGALVSLAAVTHNVFSDIPADALVDTGLAVAFAARMAIR